MNLCCFLNFTKSVRVTEIVKQIKFEGVCDKLEAGNFHNIF